MEQEVWIRGRVSKGVEQEVLSRYQQLLAPLCVIATNMAPIAGQLLERCSGFSGGGPRGARPTKDRPGSCVPRRRRHA